MFWVLKRTVSSRDSFEYPGHMFWFRNKNNNFQLRNLILGPEIPSVRSRAATFTRINGTISCFCNNVYKIDLMFTRTLACDKRHGLLIAFLNEKIFS